MRLRILSFSKRGEALAKVLAETGRFDCFHERCRAQGLQDFTRRAFEAKEALLFIGAAGIACRAVAPFLRDKLTDPPVLVMDEHGRYCIPLLSGHVGGANRLAKALAAAIGALPVITTASDLAKVFAIDTWAQKQNLSIENKDGIKRFTSKLLDGKQASLATDFPIAGKLPEGLVLQDETEGADACISMYQLDCPLPLTPRALYLGVGCRQHTRMEEILELWQRIAKREGFRARALAGIYSIDLKKHEAGLLAFSEHMERPFLCTDAQTLMAQEGSVTRSAFVQQVTGADNVCERAALWGSQGGRLLVPREQTKRVTMAVAFTAPALSFEEES